MDIINEVIGKSNKNKICDINNITMKNYCNTELKTEISNALNYYFINVGNNLEIKHINHVSDDHEIISDSLFFKPINSDEIMLHLNKIKDYNSFYENNLSNYILKNKTSKAISLPLSIIFNKSLSTYPSNFKKCIVIPLFKAGNKLVCGNYRPISISLTLSKMFVNLASDLDYLLQMYFLRYTNLLGIISTIIIRQWVFFRCTESF